MSKNKSSSGGVGFTSLLLLAFIVMKLCKVIDWDWWWVLAPLWMTGAAAFVLFVLYLVILLLQSKEKKLQKELDEIRKANSKKEN